MDIITALIIGAIVGWLAAAVTGRDEGIFGSMAIGVVGAIIGSFLSSFFSGGHSYIGITLPGLVWAFIGAVILSVVLNLVQHRSHTSI